MCNFLVFNDNIHSLVDSVSKKIGLLLPHEGDIDSPDSRGASLSPSPVDDKTINRDARKMARIKRTGTYT